MGLEGKVALVTGAGGMRSIGHAIAVRLARDGADVVVSDIDRKPDAIPPDEAAAAWRGLDSVRERVEASGRRCLPITCDITKPSEVERMVAETVRVMGRLDILVNSARAAIGADRKPVMDMDEAEWDRVLAVNLRGPMTCSKFAARQMVAAGRGGRIINISSIRSRQAGTDTSAYASSKAGLNMLTFCLALELAPHGILVTSVTAGLVDTNRVDAQELAQAAAEGVPYAEWRSRQRDRAATQIPLGRVGTPEEIAGAVSYLASEDGSFITGQTLGVTGGMDMY